MATAAHPITAEEYSELPEVPGYRDELIEGERVLAPMPKLGHTVVIQNLEDLLKRQFPEMRVVRESGWRFQSMEGIDNVPGPDLAVFTREAYEQSLRAGGYLEGRPLLVVEVVSPSEHKSRRLQKVHLYLEAGAGSVVEADYTKRILLVYSPDGDAPEVIRQGRVETPFSAELSQVFAGLV